ncbi:MAG: hypothetical protein MH252_20505 [Thermosynechococcaceae cyanobacterium MS004]|nr:hypothetical protein [Thermosynechococcaceae cyanobacterium MS004]
MMDKNSKKSLGWWIVLVGVFVTEIVLLIKLSTSQESTKEILLAIIVVSALLVLILRIEDVINFAISKDGVKADLNRVEQKVDQLGSDINALLISTVLDAYEYITLRKISGEDPDDRFEFNRPKGQDLLERLRNRRLIKEIYDGTIFSDKSNRSIKLREHFIIDKRGREYLEAINQKGIGQQLMDGIK